jgi:hypothetical protein
MVSLLLSGTGARREIDPRFYTDTASCASAYTTTAPELSLR